MEYQFTKILKAFFWAAAALVGICFIVFEVRMRDPYSYQEVNVKELTEGSSMVLADGTLLPISYDDSYFTYEDAKENEKITIVTKLPAFTDEDMCVTIYACEQDVWIYVNGELRQSYSDEAYRMAGSYSATRFVTVPLSAKDSGAELKVEYVSALQEYAGSIACPFFSTHKDMVCWILYRYAGQFIHAVLLMTVGVVFAFLGIVIKCNHKNDRGIHYLGAFSIIMAVWLLCQSNMRVFYSNYLYAVNMMTFVAIMFAPIPIMMFFNELQKYRYQKLYNSVIVLAFINILVNLYLECRNIEDMISVLWTTHIVIIVSCALCFITFLIDARQKAIPEAREIAIGVAGLVIVALIEDLNLFFLNLFYVGKYLGIGMLFFLLMLGYAAIKGMLVQEQDYNAALKANSIKSIFLANMSHEIRTPINTILGMDEMILRENEEPKIDRYAVNIRNAGRTLLSLVNDILDFTKIESGKMEIVPERYELGSILNDLVHMIYGRAEEKGLDMELEIEETIPNILFGDEIRIKQILTNLLTNAVKYTQKGSIVLTLDFLRLSEEEIQLFINVRDTGIGIRTEDQNRMFDSFVRLETDKNRSIEGTGLGMAITKQIVDMMKGTIEVKSEYGKGSSFTVSVTQRVLEDTPVGDFKKWYRQTEGRTTRYVEAYCAREVRLLAVDDNGMNLEVIKGLLKQTKMQIDTAQSGEEALRLACENTYDLILMDHMMPIMDGIETMRRLEEILPENAKKTPVVALTANAVSGARERYLRYGFADYISKPVEYGKLTEVLQKFLPDKFIKLRTEQTADKEQEAFRYKQKQCEAYLERNGIHMRAAMKYAADDFRQYCHLLELFISGKEEAQKLLHSAALKEEWKEYTVYVHGLKNSAETIGAGKLADMAYRHELNSKEEKGALIHGELEDLLEEWDKKVQIIERYFRAEKMSPIQKERTDNSKSVISDSEWEKTRKQIMIYLDTFKKKEALELLNRLSSYELGPARRRMTGQAIAAISSYDYEGAIQALRCEKENQQMIS